MIIVDVNIPIHAINRESRYHDLVRSWWDEQLSGARPVGLAWVVCFGFVRILTNPRIISPPLRVDDALDFVSSWMRQPCTPASSILWQATGIYPPHS